MKCKRHEVCFVCSLDYKLSALCAAAVWCQGGHLSEHWRVSGSCRKPCSVIITLTV